MLPDVDAAAGLPVETAIVGTGAGTNEIEMRIQADTSRPGTMMKGPAVIFRGTYRAGRLTDAPFSLD